MADPNSDSDIPKGLTLINPGGTRSTQAGDDLPPGLTDVTPANPPGAGVLLNPGGDTLGTGPLNPTVPTQSETQLEPKQKSLVGFASNILPSFGNFAGNVLHAAAHPIDTSNTLFDLFYGSGRLARRELFDPDMPEDHSEQVVKNFRNYVTNRYGSMDKAWDSFYKDPVGVMADASAALNLAGGAAKLAGTMSGVDALAGAGRGLTTAGNVTNPVTWVTAPGAAVIAKYAPKAAPAAAATEAAAPAMSPEETEAAIRQRAYQIGEARQSGDPMSDWLQAEQEIKSPQPTAPPTTTPSVATTGKIAQAIRGALAPIGTFGGLELLTHHLLGAVTGGTLAYGAIKLIPKVLGSSAGQQVLAAIGPGSTPARAAAAVQSLVPTLNALYKSQQQQPIQLSPQEQQRTQQLAPITVQPWVRAKGGTVNPELARVQRERLGFPGILEMLERQK